MKNVTKEQFVAVLRDAGITEAQMQSLHRLFETRHPDQHQAFLEHLGLAAEKIREIRARSAA